MNTTISSENIDVHYLTYDTGTLTIMFKDYTTITALKKPAFSFDYDVLHYEPGTDILRYYKGKTNGFMEEYKLTESQIAELQNFIKTEYENLDYYVYIYDSELFNAYRETIMKSQAYGKTYTKIAPEHPASIFNEKTNQWERIKAIIQKNGYLIEDPDAQICDQCALVFTEQEWKNFPSKPKKSYYVYNFKTKQFEDSRNITNEKYVLKSNLTHSLTSYIENSLETPFISPHEMVLFISFLMQDSLQKNEFFIELYKNLKEKEIIDDLVTIDEFENDFTKYCRNYVSIVLKAIVTKGSYIKKINELNTLDEIDEYTKIINTELQNLQQASVYKNSTSK